MGFIAEIEQAIAKLSAQEFIEFERWFDEERNRKMGPADRSRLGLGRA